PASHPSAPRSRSRPRRPPSRRRGCRPCRGRDGTAPSPRHRASGPAGACLRRRSPRDRPARRPRAPRARGSTGGGPGSRRSVSRVLGKSRSGLDEFTVQGYVYVVAYAVNLRGGTYVNAATERPSPAVPRWLVRIIWKAHRAAYSLSGGRIGLRTPAPRRWGTLRLTSVGRRTGRTRVAILGYLEDGPNLFTPAMNGWADPEPA